MEKDRVVYEHIVKAHEKIKDYIYETPLEKSLYLSDSDKNVFMKMECEQTVKSFKIRGALNKLLSLGEEKSNGVIAISSGNHGIAVSYGAKLLGIENVKIIVPETTPKSKVERIKYFGGQAILIGKNYDEAHCEGMKYVKEKNMSFIDGWDNDEAIYAGQGTIGIEILKQNAEIDTIIVPIGGGGLITGISVAAKAIKPDIKIIGVQTEACPAMVKSIEDNFRYGDYETKESICDALVGGVGRISFSMHEKCIDKILVVDEKSIHEAVSFAIKSEKKVIEASSAATIAAIMKYKSSIEGKNIALVISGGNIDEELIRKVVTEY